jgi:hypothetical protein
MNRRRRFHHVWIAIASAAAVSTGGWCGAQPAEAPPAAAPETAPKPPAELPEVVVYLKEGQRVSGLLVSADAGQVVVRISGINTKFGVETIERYEVLPPVMERYHELRRTIGKEPEEILRLAKWLQSREQYALALSEVQRALEVDPTHGEGIRLKALLEQQLILQTRGPANKSDDKPSPEAANPTRPQPGAFPLLAADDINLIKVYEIDMTSRPHVVISRETAQKVLDANLGHPLIPLTREGREALLRRDSLEILDLMFKLQARDFYHEVQVMDQPPAIRLFRENVARTWLMSCATSQCHGGLEAGRFVLYNRSPNSDPSVYTNLLILDRFRTRIGAGAAPSRPGEPYGPAMIDWDHPEKSPLLQLGLPREDSLFPHPVVPRPGPGGPGTGGGDIWKPEFRSVDDRLFKKGVEWIKAMYRPRPYYPVNYTPLRPFEPTPPPTPLTMPGSGPVAVPGSGEPQPR